MTLSNLIRKGGLSQIATATPATLATHAEWKTVTVAEVAPVAVAIQSPPTLPVMTMSEEAAIRAWLAHIKENDTENINEVLEQCRSDPEALRYFIQRAEEVPKPSVDEQSVTCGACIHFSRTEHPNLGHCLRGEPEAIAGLWDTDRRSCGNYSSA